MAENRKRRSEVGRQGESDQLSVISYQLSVNRRDKIGRRRKAEGKKDRDRRSEVGGGNIGIGKR
jgi:hypothetical protein